MCEDERCEMYPQYGVAPHECYHQKPGEFDNPLGTSTIDPPDTWPDNFLLEVDPGQPPQLSYGACGVHFCPSCKAGMAESESDTLWGKARALAYVNERNAPTGT